MKIDPITQAYLDGLYAAALVVMDRAKDKNSPYAADIMKFMQTQRLKAEGDVEKKRKANEDYETFKRAVIDGG